MFLRRLLPRGSNPHMLHEPEVMSEPRDVTDGEVNVEDGPVDVDIATADEKDFEPVQGADNVADAAGARVITQALGDYSPTSHQTTGDLHDEEATATIVPTAEDSNTTPDDMTREINRIKLPVNSEGDEDSYIFTASTSSSGMTRSTTLYVIYEVEQEHGVTRSEDDYEDEGWGADELCATAASSSTEVHQTALQHDVENHRLSSVQPSVLALTAGQSTITTMSPYRHITEDDTREKQLTTEEEDDRPLFEFPKRLLIWMDHLLRLDRRRGSFRKD